MDFVGLDSNEELTRTTLKTKSTGAAETIQNDDECSAAANVLCVKLDTHLLRTAKVAPEESKHYLPLPLSRVFFLGL